MCVQFSIETAMFFCDLLTKSTFFYNSSSKFVFFPWSFLEIVFFTVIFLWKFVFSWSFDEIHISSAVLYRNLHFLYNLSLKPVFFFHSHLTKFAFLPWYWNKFFSWPFDEIGDFCQWTIDFFFLFFRDYLWKFAIFQKDPNLQSKISGWWLIF